MLFLIGLALSTVVFYLLTVKLGNEGSDLDVFTFIGAMLSGVCLVVALIILPIQYNSGKAEVERYKALKVTIEESRKSEISDIERAALTKKIADYNADIASVRYWNNTTFGIYIPDELAELEYLK
ncbi:hypothetical protein [Priestia megaterium]|uniref:hypothetical protein n=1 Tax=Priestia megaterium TaxID=1404 RepID=UPI00287746F8|nr:hypothetical protein [Priestia megaterium]